MTPTGIDLEIARNRLRGVAEEMGGELDGGSRREHAGRRYEDVHGAILGRLPVCALGVLRRPRVT